MARVVHFEISTKDPEKNVVFYKEVFGWRVEKWAGPIEYWLLHTGNEDKPGIDGGLSRCESDQPKTVNTIDVADVQASTDKVVAHGGKIINPVHAVPGVGWLSYVEDPEGNQWGLMQSDWDAK